MAFSQPLLNVSDQIFLAINERSARKLWRIIKTYETSKVLASLVTFNQEGNTPVQLAICKRHFNVIDALLRPLKESTCNEHYIPLCLFVIFQVLMVKNIPIVEKMEYLVGTTNNNNISWMEFVSDSVNSSSITRLEKIVALELIGVAFVTLNTIPNILGCQRGLDCWKQAMALRYSTDADPIIPSIITDVHSPDFVQKAFGGTVQFKTIEDLDLFVTYYKENPKTWRYDDKIMIQAILISLGNFSLFNPRQASPCYLYHYLIHCYIRRKQYIRVINTAFLIIEQWKWFIPVSASSSFICLFDDALSMIFECFKLLRTAKPPNEFPSPLNLLFSTVQFLLSTAQHMSSSQLELGTDLSTWRCAKWRCMSKWTAGEGHLSKITEADQKLQKLQKSLTGHLLDLISILCEDLVSLQLGQRENQQLKNDLSQYFRHEPKNGISPSLLHMAVKRFWISSMYRETSFISLEESFARLKVLRLFLDTGANPNATDCCGCIPHNVIAQHFIKFNGLAIRNSYWMLFQTLLDAGSNLNSVNSDGKTVIDELTENLFHYCGSPYYINLDSFPVPPLPLKQLCAQVIRFHQIPIEHQLPPVLQRFVHYDSTFLGQYPMFSYA